jgi:Spy/CpxP family protein refolding chaperone
MKRVVMAAVVAVVAAGSAAAQNPPPADTMRVPMRQRMPMMGGQPMAPEQVRAQIEARWGQMVQNQLGLSDQLMDRLRTAERANQDRHRDLSRREEDLHRVVQGQLQPGVAANSDSLSRALDQLAAIRVQHAQSDQQLLRDLSFLTPVQRARYVIMARRFRERIEDIREGRPMNQPDRRPVVAPGRPGIRRPMQEDDDF